MLTQEPLSDVYIFNENKKKYTSTSDDGVFDLKFFSAKDTLTLSLIGYENKKITVEEIILNSSLIEMSVNEKKLSEIVLSVARTALQSEKITQKVKIIDKNTIVKNSQPLELKFFYWLLLLEFKSLKGVEVLLLEVLKQIEFF